MTPMEIAFATWGSLLLLLWVACCIVSVKTSGQKNRGGWDAEKWWRAMAEHERQKRREREG